MISHFYIQFKVKYARLILLFETRSTLSSVSSW